MKIFVWEYLSSGACGEEPLPASLLREGLAMLYAALKDFSREENVSLTSILDHRMGGCPIPDVEVHVAASPEEELSFYQQCAQDADFLFPVAPEFDRILSNRVELARSQGSQVLISSNEMTELFSSKLATYKQLKQAGFNVIPTEPFSINKTPDSFPIVIKPMDGAGSMNTFLVKDLQELEQIFNNPEIQKSPEKWITQPFVEGDSFSVAAIRGLHQKKFQVLPVASQKISSDGLFQYSGGTIPCDGKPFDQMRKTACKIMELFTELAGYIGFDFLLPKETGATPILMEVNPRLTTSFIGYSSLTEGTILGKLISEKLKNSPVEWKNQRVNFNSAGEILIQEEINVSSGELNQCT